MLKVSVSDRYFHLILKENSGARQPLALLLKVTECCQREKGRKNFGTTYSRHNTAAAANAN